MRPPEVVAQARQRYGLPDDYLLWVGGMEHPEPRKRVAELATQIPVNPGGAVEIRPVMDLSEMEG